MTINEWNSLVRRLENADRMSSADLASLYRDIDRAARENLTLTERLWKDHVSGDVRMPRILLVAEVARKHFQAPMLRDRTPVPLHSERDVEVARPKAGTDYRGPVVGLTPDYLVQQVEGGDYYLHERRRLVGNIGASEVDIRYPFSERGAGIVRPAALQAERELQGHVAQQHMRRGVELELSR